MPIIDSVYINGKRRVLGCLPRETALAESGFPVYRDVRRPAPRSDWGDLIATGQHDLTPFVLGIKHQEDEPSCAGNSSSATIEVVRKLSGADDVELSAMSLFKRSGTSPRRGSSLEANLREAKRGVLPVTGTPGYKHTHPRTGWETPLPDGWEETAALFALTEWDELTDFESFMSAVLLGMPISFGFPMGRGGHAEMAVKAIMQDGRRRKYGVKTAGSWGTDAGDDGFFERWEDVISRGLSTFGGWAARVAVEH